MKYSKFQKIISMLVILGFLVWFTFRVPISQFIAGVVYAESLKYDSLVSILVDESIYGDVKAKVKRYAKDIQGVMPNTKAIIIPITEDAKPFEIASLNEKIYFEWYNDLFKGKLIWTVLIWDIPVPRVFDWEENALTILPYTDFEDKVYYYSYVENKYKKASDSWKKLNAEIWHWVINPSGENKAEIINEYFDKNHKYYTRSGFYNSNELNANEPFVFYFDSLREYDSLSYANYQAYQLWREFLEDIVYRRFTKELANEIQNRFSEIQMDQIPEIEGIDTWSFLWGTASLESVPDIQTRYIIENIKKDFPEALNESVLWDIQKDVYNAWRYNVSDSDVNVDLIPWIVHALDKFSAEVIKSTNNDLEDKITDIVANSWLSKKLVLFESRDINVTPEQWSSSVLWNEPWIGDSEFYTNFIAWRPVSEITRADQCSVYRWSNLWWWKKVEANRWFNTENFKVDSELIKTEDVDNYPPKKLKCTDWSEKGFYETTNRYSWNTPFNSDLQEISLPIRLFNRDHYRSIVPVYDIKWSVASSWDSTLSPLDCSLDNYFVVKTEREISKLELVGYWDWANWVTTWHTTNIPTDWTPKEYHNDKDLYSQEWNCTKPLPTWDSESFESYADNPSDWKSNWCNPLSVYVDWELIHKRTKKCFPVLDMWSDTYVTPAIYDTRIDFKTIPSYIVHNLPNDNHLKDMIDAGATMDMPVDRDRYIDFISAAGNYKKIDFPELFRLWVEDNENLDFESIKDSLEYVLSSHSRQINDIVSSEVNSFSGDYLHLATNPSWEYPSEMTVDLYKYLLDKPVVNVESWIDSKDVTYIDTLSLALYWNALGSVQSKYNFVLENYLTDQYKLPGNYLLPGNKKIYEMAYFKWIWDGVSMHINMDPETKWDNPYWSEIENIAESNSLIQAGVSYNAPKIAYWKSKDKCFSPWWVPIWEWLPAFQCWLDDISKGIQVKPWMCWINQDPNSNWVYVSSSTNTFNFCSWDENENSISDCHELTETISFSSWTPERVYFKEEAKYDIELLANWELNYTDNDSKAKIVIERIDAVKNEGKTFSSSNSKTVYSEGWDKGLLNNYLSSVDREYPVSWWKATLSILPKSKIADIYFRVDVISYADTVDNNIIKSSETKKLKIRWDSLSIISNKLSNDFWTPVISYNKNTEVSSDTNLYLYSGENRNLSSDLELLNSLSSSKDKLFIWVDSLDSKWNSYNISYPIDLKLWLNWEIELERTFNDLWDSYIPLASITKSWIYTLVIEDAVWDRLENEIVFTPAEISNIDLIPSTNTVESWDVIMANALLLKDRFWNLVSWELYNVWVAISWNSLVIGESWALGQSDYSLDVYEWLKSFRLKSTWNTWPSTVKVRYEKVDWSVIEDTEIIRVVDNINFDFSIPSDVSVWGWEYEFLIKTTNAPNFSWVAFVNIPEEYWYFEEKINIVNWEWRWLFTTWTLAGRNINFNLKVAGIRSEVSYGFDIKPAAPVRLWMYLDKDSLEYWTWDSANVRLELQDIYGNVAYNTNSDGYRVDLELLDKYDGILKVNERTKSFTDWIANFQIHSWNISGTWYFKFEVSPNLNRNTYTVWDQVNNWYWVAIWRISNLYKLKGDKISKAYNGLYTTLVWSDYWNITKDWYFAWELVFDKDSKALVVTSLLNSGQKIDSILNLKSSWSIEVPSSVNLTQNIKTRIEYSENSPLKIAFVNDVNNTLVWKAVYDMGVQNFNVCTQNLESCIDDNNYWLYIDSSDSLTLSNSSDEIKFINKDNEVIARLSNNWRIYGLSVGYSLEIKDLYNIDYLTLSINSPTKEELATITYKVNSTLDFSRNESDLENWKIWLYLASKSYRLIENNFDWNIIFSVEYDDPFTTTKSYSKFAKKSSWGYEYYKKNWIWWNDANQSLLSFAAWESVWEATKEYASFGMINIWDPVISIDKEKALTVVKDTTPQDRPFDSTVWTLIWKFDDLLSYEVFDYNFDDKDDIVVFRVGWEIILYENYFWQYINRWQVALIPDWNEDSEYVVWDFFADWFDDIVMLNHEGRVFILDNNKKDFERIEITHLLPSEGKIIQMESYDMDNDSITDLVALDTAWNIDVYYGKAKSWDSISFDKLTIASWYSLNITDEVLDINWAIYFDELYDYSLIDSGDNIVYYDPNSPDSSPLAWVLDTFKDNINTQLYNTSSDSEELLSADNIWWVEASKLEALIYYIFNYREEANQEEIENGNNSLLPTYFLKSEYFKSRGIIYNKTYEDLNSAPLEDWDKVRVMVEVSSNELLTNVALVEKVPEVFDLWDEFIVYVNWEAYNVFESPSNSDDFTFMLKFPEISPWNTYLVQYELTTLPYEYWVMEVGLFENGEVWDDLFGDVIYKTEDTSCAKDKVLIRSVWERSYEEWELPIICWDPNFPEEIKDLIKDEDWNWVSDKKEEWEDLSNKANSGSLSTSEFLEYTKWYFDYSDYDLNWDWVYGNDWESDVMLKFDLSPDSLNEWIDSIAEKANELIKGLWCWFSKWCIETPFNWAPLAPWNDPTFLGKPIWDWLHVNEWMPIFAAPTIPAWLLPPIWPPSPSWAWWRLGWSTSTIRFFATPTLTWSSWVAICFWNNIWSWMVPPPWASPLVPWWNCVVVAWLQNICKVEWADGGHTDSEFPFWPTYVWDWFSIFVADCKSSSDDIEDPILPDEMVNNYFNNWEVSDEDLRDVLFKKDIHVSKSLFGNSKFWSVPDPTMTSVISYDSNDWFKFQEPVAVKNLKIYWFPWIVMQWVNDQFEEIINKITEFPRLIVILPSFEWMTDSLPTETDWNKISEQIQWDSWKKVQEIDNKISLLEKQLDSLPAGDSKYYDIQSEIVKLEWEKLVANASWNWVVSSSMAAFELVSKLPIINIEEEQVNIEIPSLLVMPEAEFDRLISELKVTKEQWENEISDKSEKWWKILEKCNSISDQEKRAQCIETINPSIEILTDFDRLVSQIDRNIEILESYKDFPRELYYFLEMKQEIIDSIICNVEVIYELISWWIERNWETFKAWVELYITVKAILKTWQAFLDIFYWYEMQCKECKNERFDLINFVIELILPKIPVIKFPKWPDIIFDLHNIKAGITIVVPTIDVKIVPLALPSFPILQLPDVPSLNFALDIKLPEIWTLPEIKLPELPEIPSLPEIVLPDLPPPPKLPPLFPEIAALVDLMKLVTLAMCILKFSPMHPEWRAWDQIAFLTENPWFLNLHFMFDMSIPAMDISYIDAIKVTTYVNYEKDLTFLVDIVKDVVDNNINSIQDNLSNAISWWVRKFDYRNSIDLRDLVPTEINVEWTVDFENWSIDWWIDTWLDANIWSYQDFALNLWKWINSILLDFTSKSDNEDVVAREVTDKLYKVFHSEEFSWQEYAILRDIWSGAKNYDFAKEGKFINELKQYNDDKFNLIIWALENEKSVTSEEKVLLEKLLETHRDSRLINDIWNSSSRIKAYNEWLAKYNNIELTKDNSYDLALAKEIVSTKEATKEHIERSSFLAYDSWDQYDSESWSTCSTNWGYDRVYKWLFINKYWKNYRLFDYVDNYRWDSELKVLDFDNDSDEDILYDVDWHIFLKTNMDIHSTVNNSNTYIEDKNIFENFRSDFIPAVSSFGQSLVESRYVNLYFTWIDNTSVSNYRIEAEKIVDKFWYDDWIVENKAKTKMVVDMFVDIDKSTLTPDSNVYEWALIRKNIWHFEYIWNLSWVEIETYSFDDLLSKLSSWIIVTVTPWTKIYTWGSSSKITISKDWEELTYNIPSKSNIEFEESVQVIWVEGDAFIASDNKSIFTDSDVNTLRSKPVLPWTRIISVWDNQNTNNITIEYYDSSELSFNLKDVWDYEMYDLWARKTKYNVRLSRNNDFYYAKLKAFRWSLHWTYSETELLSPQIQADYSVPSVFINRIEIPVYTSKEFYFEEFTYDDSGIVYDSVYIDSDIEKDSDLDWHTDNDADVFLWGEFGWISLVWSNNNLKLKVWPFDNVFEKTIKLFVTDEAWNLAKKDIVISSYAPIPTIYSNTDEIKLNGQLDSDTSWIPVDLFRVRGGKLTKITLSWEEVESYDEWNFEFNSPLREWIHLKSDWNLIAFIDEHTGRIDFEEWYSFEDNTRVLPTWDSGNTSPYPLIIVEVWWREIYTQYVSVPNESEVRVVTDFSEISSDRWMFVKFVNQSSYDSVILPQSIPINPWAMIIHHTNEDASNDKITISRDWKIRLKDDNLSMKLSSSWDNLVYEIYDGETHILDILVKPEPNSIIK